MAFWGKSASPSMRQHGMADWPGSMRCSAADLAAVLASLRPRPCDTVGCAIGRRCANWCAALMPKAQYNEYGNAAHGHYLAHTDRLNADLLAFIKS